MNKVPPPPPDTATINVLGPVGLGVATTVGVGGWSVDFEVGPIDLEVRTIVEMLGKNTITVNRNNDSLLYFVDLVMLNKYVTLKDAKKKKDIIIHRLEEMMGISIYLPSN